jgi:DNA-directed RNA polymerase sigma subunit (sigma70/sigma32)
VLYSALDTDELNGEEMLPDVTAVSIEDAVITKMLIEQLRRYLPLLPVDERSLIDALFFSNNGEGMSEREYAAISGIPRKTIAYRRAVVLDKLKKFLES